MKKVFAVLLATIAVTSVFAQSGRRYDHSNSGDVVLGQGGNVYNDNRYNNRYDNNGYTDREREVRIAQINRAYDMRIMSVQRDRYLRNAEKRRQVRMLEMERAEQIRMVRDRYSDRRNDWRDRNYPGNGRY